MEESVRRSFTWPKCCEDIDKYIKACDVCQKSKLTNKKRNGKIPLKEDQRLNLFKVLSVDLCGPWPIEATVQEFKKSSDGQKKSKTKEIVEKTTQAQIWKLTIHEDECTAE